MPNFPGQEEYNKIIRDKLQKAGMIKGDELEFEVDIKNLAVSMFKSIGLTVVAGNNNTDDTNRFWSHRDNQTRNDGIDGRNLVVVAKK